MSRHTQNEQPRFGSGFHRVSAGLADAGLASAGMFLVGVYAARVLGVEDLGAYAVFQSALFLAAVLPAQGIYLPSQAAALELPPSRRLEWLRSSVIAGLPLAALASAGVLVASATTFTTVDGETLLALTVTSALAAALSPIQDHVRKMMHVAEVSHLAALTSAAFTASTVAGLVLLHLAGMSRVWVPLGALALGNAISIWAGLRLGGPSSAGEEAIPDLPSRSTLWKSGRWLTLAGAISPLATFITVSLVTWLAGAAAMGMAEAARVLAQPVFVFGVGVASVLAPRSMEAAKKGSETEARALRRRFTFLNIAFTVPYALAFGWATELNPLTEAFPAAYVVSGLVALQLVGNLIWMLTRPFQAELVGAGAERRLTLAQAIGNALQPLTAISAIGIGAVAKPLSDLISGLGAYAAQRRMTRDVYRSRHL